jgi:hypothetical protein
VAIEAFHRLRQFEGRPGVTVASKGEALELTLVRGDIEVRVTVPENVLEWFVEAKRRSARSGASDWFDYEGYDETPFPALENDMAEEMTAFVDQLIERDLRYDEEKNVLEWSVNGQWQQAVPYVMLPPDKI